MPEHRVAITGMGVLSGYGRGTAALWSGLESGHSSVRTHRAHLGRRAWERYPMAALSAGTAAIACSLPKSRFVIQSGLGEVPDLVAIADCIRQSVAPAGLSSAPH